MFSGQVRRSRSEACPAIDVHRFREILMLRTLDHYLLANVAKRVCDRACRYVATKHMAHVFPGRSVSCYVSKVPENNTHLRIECMSDLEFPLILFFTVYCALIILFTVYNNLYRYV